MTFPRPCSAVLLAAGRSTRMGRDKAILEIDGLPAWQRQRDLLASLGPLELFLSARADQPWSRRAAGFTAVLQDAVPELGPLSGVTAALERSTTPHLVVLAIDLPAITADWFRSLGGLCAPGVGAVGRQEGGFEPLAAIYPREWMSAAWAALAGGRYSLQPLLQAGVAGGILRVRPITEDEAPFFANRNDPAGAETQA